MMTIDKFNFAGKKAIVRVDFNVPLNEEGKITDDTRIRGALPTLKKILADGGALIIMSHMGKPKGKVNAKYSLSQIVDAVAAALGTPVKFAPDCAKAQDAAAALKPGEVLLLENLRFYPEEEGKPVGIEKEDPAYEDAKKEMKARQKEFAKTLASYADCYVMDAFGTAHRKHASTAVIADYFDADHKMLGYLMEKEVKAVNGRLISFKTLSTAFTSFSMTGNPTSCGSCIEVISDNSCRSMFTVSSTESIHYIAVSVRSQSLSKFFLTSFHFFLSIFVCRIFFFDTYRFAFFFRIETKIFEQQYFTRFQCSSSVLSFCTVWSEFNRSTQSSSNSVYNLAQRIFSVYFTSLAYPCVT